MNGRTLAFLGLLVGAKNRFSLKALFSVPRQVNPHLGVANSHHNHGQEVGQYEEDDVVSKKILLKV